MPEKIIRVYISLDGGQNSRKAKTSLAIRLSSATNLEYSQEDLTYYTRRELNSKEEGIQLGSLHCAVSYMLPQRQLEELKHRTADNFVLSTSVTRYWCAER